MKMQPNMSEMFNQAIETFDSALKIGVKIQEEATKWWTDMLQETDTLQEFRQRAQSMMMVALPTTQKSVDQYMKLLDTTYHSSMELINKAFQATQSDSLTDAQARIQEFWQATFTAMRTNAQAIVQVNTRAMEAWAEMARHNSGETWEAAQEAGEDMAKAAAHARRGTARSR